MIDQPQDQQKQAKPNDALSELTDVLERIGALATYHRKQEESFLPFGTNNAISVFHRNTVKTLNDAATILRSNHHIYLSLRNFND